VPTRSAPLVVWDMLQVPEQLRSVADLLVMDRVSERFDIVQGEALEQRHLLVIEELWELMRDRQGAVFVDTFCRKARKRHVGLTAVTQQASDLLGSERGRAVVDNADTQIVLRQSRQAIEEVAKHFGLSDGERRWLVGCRRGEGILIAGQDRVAFRSVAAPDVEKLITTDPDEVADLARAETEQLVGEAT
jgi:type IV secretory pathway VirB4 component